MNADDADTPSPALEIWGGVEATCNRVGDRWFDQLAWSGHDRRIEDLDAFAGLGLAAVRYPVLLERHAPHDIHSIDWSWSDARLDRLRRLGLRPIVGLVHHGSGPGYTSLVDARFPAHLARFAGALAQRYPWIEDFTPINEPLTTARFSGLYGHWYPHEANARSFARALLNQIAATREAMRAIRAVTPAARLIQTEDCGEVFGTQGTVNQAEHEQHRRWLTWDLLTGRVTPHHPLWDFLRWTGIDESELWSLAESPCPPDVVGLNYYVTSDRYLDDHLEGYPPSLHGGNEVMRYVDVDAVRARSDGIVGHRQHLLDAWHRYHLPVAITEVHMGCTREEQMRWLVESWRGAQAAAAAGAHVKAVTAWALLGSFNWSSLVTRDSREYEPGVFDVRAAVPRATALASIVREISRGANPSHPVLCAPGWWHRPERLVYAATQRAVHHPGLPLLIVGDGGPLMKSLEHACIQRALPAIVVSPWQLHAPAALASHRPWAVLNASAHGRTHGNASADAVAAEIQLAVNLATACRDSGVSLVTFSTDLVFDGLRSAPYLESTPLCPRGEHGVMHAEIERLVLEILPTGMLIRTTALFSPWDDCHFPARLTACIDSGHSFEAAVDAVVSPTYTPDLAHAALDLLIDGEHGIWHLTNETAVSWWEFALLIATESQRSAERIRAVNVRTAHGTKSEPAYLALGSERAHVMRPLASAVAAYLHTRRRLAPA